MLRLRSMCMLSVLSVFGVFVSDVIFRNNDVRMREMIKKEFFHHAKAKQPSYIYIYIYTREMRQPTRTYSSLRSQI